MPPFGQRSPNNPIMRDAQQFRDSLSAGAAPQVAPAPAPAPQAAPAPAPQAAPAAAPAPAPQPVVRQNALQMAPPPEYAAALGETVAPAPYQAMPQPQPDANAQAYAELAESRDQIRRYEEELKALRAEHAQATQELSSLRESKDLDDYLAQADLGSIRTEDARKLISPLLKTFKTERDNMQRNMLAQRDEVNQRFAALAQHEQTAKQHKALDAIYKAHPDLQAMQRTQAYSDVMLTPVSANSKLLVGQLVASELQKGNADYVIDVLNQVRARMGSGNSALASVASVGAGSNAASAAPATGGGALSPSELEQLNHKFLSRQISRAEYHEALAKHRAATSP